jgi:DNA uptake protein ComE-like DNA-binding protein
MNPQLPTNRDIAKLLKKIATLLEIQHANPHRVRAYRKAADIIMQSNEEMATIVVQGNGMSLKAIPGIGENLAKLIIEYVQTRNSKLLQRLQGEITPLKLFEQVPGIGKGLAEKIVKELKVQSLEELEQAAMDGRLLALDGVGPKRSESIRLILAGMLSGNAWQRNIPEVEQEKKSSWKPPIGLLLEIDQLYRIKAAKKELKTISPRRFNPNGLAWLPIFHTELGKWDFTALYSNTARAHELKKTDDWVVIFFEKNGLEGQATVVTETSGQLKGKRVVRGREIECSQFYKERNNISESLWVMGD